MPAYYEYLPYLYEYGPERDRQSVPYLKVNVYHIRNASYVRDIVLSFRLRSVQIDSRRITEQ